MLFVETVKEYLNEYENTVETEENEVETPVSQYITSLACGQYQKAVEDIANTVVGNKRVKRRTLQQVMQESFFCGANRFGNNFIA